MLAASVYHKGDKVDRLMAIGELMDAYNVKLYVQSHLKEFWKRKYMLPSLGFVEQIPTKVLLDLGSRIIGSLALPTGLGNNSEVDSDATVCHGNHKSVSLDEVFYRC